MAIGSETQRDWEDKIGRALKSRKEWETEFKCEVSESYFEGKQNPGWSDEEWINVPKIYSRVTGLLPVLVDANPYFYVKVARTRSQHPMEVALMSQKAEIREAKLNHAWKECDGTGVVRMATQDAQFRYGVAKVHFSASEKENERAGQTIMSDKIDDLTGEQRPLLDDEGQPLIEPDMLPVDEKYHITRVDPRDFIWGEDSGPLEQKWTWCAERFTMSLDLAKKDGRFKRAGLPKSGGKPDEDGTARTDPITGRPREAKDEDLLVGWEIYDLKNRRWMIIFEGADQPAKRWEAFPPGVEEHPYSVLRFVLRSKGPYPIPPVSQALDPAREVSVSRSRILRHRKRFNRKYEVNLNALHDVDDDLSRLESGDDGTIIRVKQPGAINAIADAPLDQQTYIELGHLGNDIVEVLGPQTADLARSDSATEAALIDKAESTKDSDRKNHVAVFATTLARKLDQLIAANLTVEEAVRVVGPSGEAWQQIGPSAYSDIAGEFDYSINAGATVPRLPQIERAQFMAILQLLGTFPHLLTSPRMMDKIFEMHHIDDQQLLDELMQIGQMILGGQVAAPGGQQMNPMSGPLGAAAGPQGGVVNGGGSPNLQEAF